MSDVSRVFELIKEHEVSYVEFRFTDPRGKLQHVSVPVSAIDEETFDHGIMFDGSSIAGWKVINESDMTLMPDPSTVALDPFTAMPTLAIFCNVHDPVTAEAYARDPRSVARRAEMYLQETRIADMATFGPEAEFFIFDDVRFGVEMNRCFYQIDDEEGPYNSGRKYESGNLGHRPGIKGGYFPVSPVDRGTDIRSEMLNTLKEMGVVIEKHHHEVAPSQHELGMKYDTLVKCADHLQLYKYVVHNVAHQYNKTATFMPKPVFGDNGSGMHVHQALWREGQALFAGHLYAELSEMALWYIGGIIKHARALNAFTNPTTNSYKRLVPGYEAPVLLAYSARNRSAACRIPYSSSPKGKRVEVRFPDPAANPYLAFAAMLMAGLDGIENKISPSAPIDKNLYDLPPEELENVPTVCGSLRQALTELETDQNFLKKGGVFTEDMLQGYLELKWQEVEAFETSPHPIEYQMYYSV